MHSVGVVLLGYPLSVHGCETWESYQERHPMDWLSSLWADLYVGAMHSDEKEEESLHVGIWKKDRQEQDRPIRSLFPLAASYYTTPKRKWHFFLPLKAEKKMVLWLFKQDPEKFMNLRMYVYRGQIDSPLTWPNNRIKDSRSDNKTTLDSIFFFARLHLV